MEVLADLERLGLKERLDMSPHFWRVAGELKSRFRRVSLADCFGIALALETAGVMVTCDHHEYDRIAEAGACPVRFVR